MNSCKLYQQFLESFEATSIYIFPGVKRPGRGAEHPPPPSVEVENE
jgi:hypothetical protein